MVSKHTKRDRGRERKRGNERVISETGREIHSPCDNLNRLVLAKKTGFLNVSKHTRIEGERGGKREPSTRWREKFIQSPTYKINVALICDGA